MKLSEVDFTFFILSIIAVIGAPARGVQEGDVLDKVDKPA